MHSFGERLQYIPEFKELTFKECCILLGGSVNKENRIEIFNEAAPCKETLLNDLSRGKRITNKFLPIEKIKHFLIQTEPNIYTSLF